MKIAIMDRDVTRLTRDVTWSGDRTQAARKLEFTLLQDDRDPRLPVIEFDNGYTVKGFTENDQLVCVGKIEQTKNISKTLIK